ncbi:MAG: glycosyltransferase family 4 protein [Emcibacter sp.]|nr:glycosyltransferase family 4 protein [Emcibacter sp.]
MTRPRLITLGFNIYGTGLTRVMQTVTRRLSDRFDIDYLGIGYTDPVSVVEGVSTHPTNMSGGGDVYGAFQALEMVAENPPDVLFILHDIWTFKYYCRVLAPVRKTTRLIAYIPLDGNIVDPRIALPLRGLDRVIVYTEWAAEELRAAFNALVAGGEIDDFPMVDVVYHGVETTTFAPDPALVAAEFDRVGRSALKRQIFPEIEDLDNSFIVLNAARPDIRKRVDITIKGFARFAKDKPSNVKLCLHHAITEEETSDLLSLIDTFNIRDRVIYNPLSPNGGPLSEADLAKLYRACDVGINTAMGEGWGLVSFEHASTGAAQIIPNHTACGALWDSSTAQMVEPASWKVPNFSPLEMGEVDPSGVANALNHLYSDRPLLQRLSRTGSNYANNPEFKWDAIADQFAAIFNNQVSPGTL